MRRWRSLNKHLKHQGTEKAAVLWTSGVYINLLSEWPEVFRLFLSQHLIVPPWFFPGLVVWCGAQELPKTHRMEHSSHQAPVHCFCTLTYISFHCHFSPITVDNILLVWKNFWCAAIWLSSMSTNHSSNYRSIQNGKLISTEITS